MIMLFLPPSFILQQNWTRCLPPFFIQKQRPLCQWGFEICDWYLFFRFFCFFFVCGCPRQPSYRTSSDAFLYSFCVQSSVRNHRTSICALLEAKFVWWYLIRINVFWATHLGSVSSALCYVSHVRMEWRTYIFIVCLTLAFSRFYCYWLFESRGGVGSCFSFFLRIHCLKVSSYYRKSSVNREWLHILQSLLRFLFASLG